MKHLLCALVMSIGLCACGATQKSQYYTLSSRQALPRVAESTVSAETVSWQLSAVTIPQMLDRPQIVTRSGENTVDVHEYQRWAEPLDTMIDRILKEDMQLSSTLPAASSDGDPKDISVTIEEFDADESGNVILWATGKTKIGNRASEFTFRQTATCRPGDMNAITDTMSKLLNALADAIARQY